MSIFSEENKSDLKVHDIADLDQEIATPHYGRPLLQFDPKAEAKLRTKIDWYIVPTVSLLYLFCFIDRVNIGNARLAGFERDLGLKGYDYNWILTVFYISYTIFEIPATMTCKWIGPGWFLPATTLAFGLISIMTAFVKNVYTAAGLRFVLGVFEAGVLPGVAYYLSRWYRRRELAFRLGLYMLMAPLAGAFGGLFASAILKLDNFAGLHKWRMLFAIEGIITCGLSLIAFFTLTDRPATAVWLTQEEKALAIARVKSERIGQTEVLDKLDTKKALRGIMSPVTLATAAMFLLNNITVQGLAFFLPTIVRTIYPHHSVISQQLRTVPPYLVGGFFTIFFPLLSWRFDRRNIFFIIGLPLVMAGYTIFLTIKEPQVRYGATFLIASGSFIFGPLCNAQVSANVISDTARSSAIGMNVMMGNIGGLISTWSFLPFDGPDYHIGNTLNLAASSVTLIIAIGLNFWMRADNKKRQRKHVELELTGKNEKITEDLDWEHPAFRWRS